MNVMSKDLQTGLLSIQGIASLDELSILMDALALRMRELTPEQEVEVPQELKDKIHQRRQAYLNGEVKLTDTLSVLDKLRTEFAPRS